jgi:hypothetical protein
MIIQSSSVIAEISILSEICSELMKISPIRAVRTLNKSEDNLDVAIDSVSSISEDMMMRRMQNSECEL